MDTIRNSHAESLKETKSRLPVKKNNSEIGEPLPSTDKDTERFHLRGGAEEAKSSSPEKVSLTPDLRTKMIERLDTLRRVDSDEAYLRYRPGNLDTGEHVRFIQSKLNDWARQNGRANLVVAEDGVFDKSMNPLVEAFQLAHGLSGDKVVGLRTWRKIEDYCGRDAIAKDFGWTAISEDEYQRRIGYAESAGDGWALNEGSWREDNYGRIRKRVSSAGEIASTLLRHGCPRDKVVLWTAIALAESGGDATCVYNPRGTDGQEKEHSVGWFQINRGPRAHGAYHAKRGWTDEDVMNPELNVAEAARISRGWVRTDQWGAFKNGRYEKFLRDAEAGVASL